MYEKYIKLWLVLGGKRLVAESLTFLCQAAGFYRQSAEGNHVLFVNTRRKKYVAKVGCHFVFFYLSYIHLASQSQLSDSRRIKEIR